MNIDTSTVVASLGNEPVSSATALVERSICPPRP
jgi:hypothetical protein